MPNVVRLSQFKPVCPVFLFKERERFLMELHIELDQSDYLDVTECIEQIEFGGDTECLKALEPDLQMIVNKYFMIK